MPTAGAIDAPAMGMAIDERMNDPRWNSAHVHHGDATRARSCLQLIGISSGPPRTRRNTSAAGGAGRARSQSDPGRAESLRPRATLGFHGHCLTRLRPRPRTRRQLRRVARCGQVSRPGFPRRAPVSSPGRHTTRRRGSMLHHMMARATGRRLLGGWGLQARGGEISEEGDPCAALSCRRPRPARAGGSTAPYLSQQCAVFTAGARLHRYGIRTWSVVHGPSSLHRSCSTASEKKRDNTCMEPRRPAQLRLYCTSAYVLPSMYGRGRATRQAITGRGGLSRNSVVEPSLAHPCTVAQTARHLQLAPPQIFVLHFRTVGPRRWRTRHATYYTGYDMPAEDGTTDEDEKEPTVL
jgi:hypothetical protein